MIKYRFYACKHLTSDILQRTYLNQEQTYDILSTFKSREKQHNKHNIYVFKKSKGGNRKVYVHPAYFCDFVFISFL